MERASACRMEHAAVMLGKMYAFFDFTHRNRFFSRSRHGDEEIGMANIPEGDLDSSSTGTEKIDPRTGLISPRAVRSSEDTRPPMSSGALHPVTSMGSERHFNAPQRARTDNFEMRRM